ncbi:hypothetical protein MHU86_12809 [Fragilaria crotonensis]|nr:hypothetical protein MHU86_12809 [Fragilaria crotonensis]
MISFLLDGGSKSILSQLLRNLHYVHVASSKTAESANEHFLRCQKNDARISGLKHLLSDKTETSPHLLCRRLVVEGIKFWHTTGTNDFHPNLASFPHHMREAITKVARHQSSIGWDNVQKG